MANSFWYGKAAQRLFKATGELDFDDPTAGLYKILLTKGTGYTPNSATDDFVSVIGANESDATGYTGGFGGSGRKALDNRAVNLISGKVIFDNTVDPTWNPIGGTTNNTLQWGIVHKVVTNDAASILILALDVSAVTTNGGSFTATFADGATLGIGYIGY